MRAGRPIGICTMLVCALLITSCGPIVPEPEYHPDGDIDNVFTLKYSVLFKYTLSYLKSEGEIGVRSWGGSVGDRQVEDTAYFSIEPGSLSILSKAPSGNHFKTPVSDSTFKYDSVSKLTKVSAAYLSDTLVILAGQVGSYDQSSYGPNSFKAALEIKSVKNNFDSLYTFGDQRDYSNFSTIYLRGNAIYLAGATSDVNGGSVTGYNHSPSFINFAEVNLDTFESKYKLLSFKGNEKPDCQIVRLIIHDDLAIILGSKGSIGNEPSFIASFVINQK